MAMGSLNYAFHTQPNHFQTFDTWKKIWTGFTIEFVLEHSPATQRDPCAALHLKNLQPVKKMRNLCMCINIWLKNDTKWRIMTSHDCEVVIACWNPSHSIPKCASYSLPILSFPLRTNSRHRWGRQVPKVWCLSAGWRKGTCAYQASDACTPTSTIRGNQVMIGVSRTMWCAIPYTIIWKLVQKIMVMKLSINPLKSWPRRHLYQIASQQTRVSEIKSPHHIWSWAWRGVWLRHLYARRILQSASVSSKHHDILKT